VTNYSCVVIQKLDYHWNHTKTIQTDCEVLALAWNLDGLYFNAMLPIDSLMQFIKSL